MCDAETEQSSKRRARGLTRTSVVISTHNYADYLHASISSALQQVGAAVDVVVVDDASTDGTEAVAAKFANRVRYVRHERNSGQTTALSTGFALARGDIIIFLDADDVLLGNAVSAVEDVFEVDPRLVGVGWPLLEMTADAELTGCVVPPWSLEAGDLLARVLSHGPDSFVRPPMSGNAWSRGFLEQVLPLPDPPGTDTWPGLSSPDALLTSLAPLFGRTASIDRPLARYRVHGSNKYAALDFERRLAKDIVTSRHRREVVRAAAQAAGHAVTAEWPESWAERTDRAVRQLTSVAAPGSLLSFADGGTLGLPECVLARRFAPFLGRDGSYWGMPSAEDEAQRGVEQARGDGCDYLVIAWPAFWLLDGFPLLRRTLADCSDLVLDTADVKAFRFRR